MEYQEVWHQVRGGWGAFVEEHERPPAVIHLPYRAAVGLITGNPQQLGRAAHDAVMVLGPRALETHLIPELLGSQFRVAYSPGATLRFE